MNESDEFYEIDLREYLALLNKRKWLIILIVLTAGIIGHVYSQYLPPVYQVESLIMVENSSSGLSDMANFPFDQKDKLLGTYSRLLKTRKILGKVLTEIDEDESVTVKGMENALGVEILPDTNLIRITFLDTDPELACTIVNKLIKNFIIDNRNLKIAATSGARNYVSEQLDQVTEELRLLENDARKFKEENGIVVLAETGKKLQERLLELEKSLAATNIDINSHKAGIAYLQKKLTQEQNQVLSSQTINNNPLIADLKKQLVELELKLASLSNIYTEQHPEMIKLRSEKNVLQTRIDNSVEEIVASSVYTKNPIYQNMIQDIITFQGEVVSLEAKKGSVQLQLEEEKKLLSELPAQELEHSRLQRRLQVTEKLYTMLLTRFQELKISEAMEISDIKVVDPAVVPVAPVSPNKKLNLAIAIILGLFIGIFITFLLEFFDTTIKDPEELEDLTDTQLIGYIPDFKNFSDFDE